MPSLLPALGASYERVAVVVALLAVLLTADLMGRFGRSRFNVAGKVRCVLLPAECARSRLELRALCGATSSG